MAPLILPVPGNHDLQRPGGRNKLLYRVLDRYHQGADDEDVRLIDEELWNRREALLHRSHLPEDFWIQVEIEDTFPLGIVALNSTWQQYQGGDFERRLLLPTWQFGVAPLRKRGGRSKTTVTKGAPPQEPAAGPAE